MQSAIKSERVHRVFHDVLQVLSLAQQSVLIDAVQLVTDDREAAIKAGGDAVGPACCKAGFGGRAVVFVDSNALIKQPVDYVAAAIAHELAHVALGHTRYSAKSAEQYEDDEMAADGLAAAWGYRSLVKEHYMRMAGI